LPRLIQDLCGSDWSVQGFKDGSGYREIFGNSIYSFKGWMPASIPGNIRLDLMRNQKIADPYYGTNNKTSQWVNDFEWWYKKEFTLAFNPSENPNKIVRLIFQAVDYFAEFWLNGTKLGTHEGMFGTIVFDVTTLLQEQNLLLVRLAASKNFPNRFKVIKCQMSYGWDWAPKMIPAGIWDRVYLEFTAPIYLESWFLRTSLQNSQRAQLKCTFEIMNKWQATSIDISIRLQGKNFDYTPLTYNFSADLEVGLNNVTYQCSIPDPVLWYPWDKGKPNLYTCEITLTHKGIEQDQVSDSFGIRDFNLRSQNLDSKYYPWIFEINGQKSYIRGANWVPSDMLFGRLNRGRYQKNIQLAKEANINLLRVWGGGIIDKKSFFEICDEEGMMVWQEFPIACVFTNKLPTSEKYLSILEQEAASIVKKLRNHPSLLLWCGGNEFHSKTNAHVIALLKQVVDKYDERIFIPASPEGGDNHNYAVFHGLGPYSLYLEDEFPFVSEFGLSSFPNFTTLKKYVPESELYFWSSVINYRAPHVIFFQGHKLRIQRYALPFTPPNDLPTIIQATQQGQGIGLKTAIEHYRRRKINWQNAGCAIWQLNQPWPCISWCIFEYDYEKKLAFDYVRIAYQPVLVSLKYDLDINYCEKDKKRRFRHPTFEADIYLINDLEDSFPSAELKIQFLSQDNTILDTLEKTFKIPPNSCIQADHLSYTFPPDLVTPPKIHLFLFMNGQLISKNFYNLQYSDPISNKKMGRLMKRASDILMYEEGSRFIRLLKTAGIALCIIPIFLYLAIKIKWKWRSRQRAFFEYENASFFQNSP